MARDRGPESDDTAMTLETQRSGARAGSAEAARVPGLVIVGHPDPARIGDRAWLADLASPGSEARLSRTEPPFAAPKMNAFAPLDEPHLSRSPLMLHCNMDGLRLDASGTSTKVVVDGAPLAGELALSDAALERGVVIELAGRVTLVLTRLGPPAATAVDALGMVGLSDGIARVRRDIANVADTEVPVLVRGETGSGKELVARALHAESPRARGPFVAVNVAGLPETLAAAELFGHERGAFSGADRPRRGLFGEARGGTLFLDEIGDASPDVQVLLLRALETGEVRPVGADRAVPVDVRLVAATDRDLDLATVDGAFRSPLYHRLAGYVIAVPPLQARRADVGLLLAAFLAAERAALGEAPLAAASTPWLASADLSRLVRYGWPGNVRELRNAARQIAIASRGAAHASLGAHLEGLLAAFFAAEGAPDDDAGGVDEATTSEAPGGVSPAPRRRPQDIGEDELVAALRAHRWKIGPTAAALGIAPRPSLYDLIDKSARIRKASDVGEDELRAACAAGEGLDALAERLEVSRRGLQLRLRELGLAG